MPNARSLVPSLRAPVPRTKNSPPQLYPRGLRAAPPKLEAAYELLTPSDAFVRTDVTRRSMRIVRARRDKQLLRPSGRGQRRMNRFPRVALRSLVATCAPLVATSSLPLRGGETDRRGPRMTHSRSLFVAPSGRKVVATGGNRWKEVRVSLLAPTGRRAVATGGTRGEGEASPRAQPVERVKLLELFLVNFPSPQRGDRM